MTRFMTTTALAAALMAGGAAFAQGTPEHSGMFRAELNAGEIHASEFLGMRVYASESGVDASDAPGLQDGWEDVGEINDIIFNRDGTVDAVRVDIGGFLGMGERQVALNMDAITFVSDSATEDQSDFFLVIPAARADLEIAPEYDFESVESLADDTVAAAEDVGNDVMEKADDAGEVMAQAADQTDTMVREGYDAAKVEDLTADDLTGARVYDRNDKWVGEVEQLLLADTGKIEGAVIDVGGFLGLGEKPVELSMDKLDILRERDNGAVRVFVALTKNELESMPSYEE